MDNLKIYGDNRNLFLNHEAVYKAITHRNNNIKLCTLDHCKMCKLFTLYDNFRYPESTIPLCKTLNDITDDTKSFLIKMLDFEDQDKILYDFSWYGEFFGDEIQCEFVRFIHNIWNKTKFIKYIRIIKAKMRHFWRSTINPEIECANGIKNQRLLYVCALYPLLGKEGLDMFNDISTIAHDDTYLWMFTTLKYIDPNDNFEYIKNILLYWSTTGNIKFSIRTTKLLASLLMDWKKIGFDCSFDDEFMTLLECENINRYIKSEKNGDNNNASECIFNENIASKDLEEDIPLHIVI
jgi:hypothetical protein